ncbi:conserved Plasmodium protein, unknown function [Plasmodium sp. gorilla clade G2]|uniref:conserved Plasmodium protein, unknown function n=1 Tax=Plasmodium sp. gorilla clade G2 TaxID=880535 RepID=UPI000D2050AF|nr:conserved Plasmodium protein, unknown function [Plasmodium sp. gorilla clade G2]SOV10677.1 conserved Plasmodium protein, unknown function [Plasmodium sp. gorilla clade G2]
MYDSCYDNNYLHNFEYNLIKSYDTIKKIPEKRENINIDKDDDGDDDNDDIYIHTKNIDNLCLKKKIYLLGLNYDEYILLRGSFRFRVIKGLIKFNGEIIKPSYEYRNVLIPHFYPLFKLIALNVNNIKYKDKKFIYDDVGLINVDEGKKKSSGALSIFGLIRKNSNDTNKNNDNNKNGDNIKNVDNNNNILSNSIIHSNHNNVVILNNNDNMNTFNITSNKDNLKNINFDVRLKDNDCIYECAQTVLKNYLFGLNLLPEDNFKRKDFYEYIIHCDKEDVASYSSCYMINTMKLSLYFEKYPIIIAFEKKKDFLYYLYNNNSGPTKLNLSNFKQNNTLYIDTYQFSYILKEFLLYISNKKTYKIPDIIKKVEDVDKNLNNYYLLNNVDKKSEKPINESISKDVNYHIDKDGVVRMCDPGNCETRTNLSNDTKKYMNEDKVEILGVQNESSKLDKDKWWNNFKINKGKENIFEISSVEECKYEIDENHNFVETKENDNVKKDDSIFSLWNTFSISIIGDKGKGKSFFVINFINNLLNYYKGVILIDIDVGQPIIGLSGFLSIYKIKCPINNYNFFYVDKSKYKCIKKIFFGSCSINENVNYFIKCLEYLYYYLYFVYLKKKEEKKNKKKKSGKFCFPIVINTFGWIKNIGLFLLNLNIYLSKCNFVIQIDSLKIPKTLKRNMSKQSFHSYMFNDLLLIRDEDKENTFYSILNLNNKKVNVISKKFSIFNIISEYSKLDESHFIFYNFSMSFQNEEEKGKEKERKRRLSNVSSYASSSTYNSYNLSGVHQKDGYNYNMRGYKSYGNYDNYDNYENYGNTMNDMNSNNNNNNMINTYYGSYKSSGDYYKKSYNSSSNNNSNLYYDNNICNYSKNMFLNNHTKSNIINHTYNRAPIGSCPSFNNNNGNNRRSNPCSLMDYMHKAKHLKFDDNVMFSSNVDRYEGNSRGTLNENVCYNNKIGHIEYNNNNNNINNNNNYYYNDKNRNDIYQFNESNYKNIEKYDYYISKMSHFFDRNCVRVINYVSYKKFLSYNDMDKKKYKDKSASILPKNLRAYRFFSYFFYKFKEIIFYIHSYSFYDGLNDFFFKHESYVRSFNFSSLDENIEQEIKNMDGDKQILEDDQKLKCEGEEKSLLPPLTNDVIHDLMPLESTLKSIPLNIINDMGDRTLHIDVPYLSNEDDIKKNLNKKDNSAENNNNEKIVTSNNMDDYHNNNRKDENNKTNHHNNNMDNPYNNGERINNTYYEDDKVNKKNCIYSCVLFDLKNIKLSNFQFKNDSSEFSDNEDFIAFKYFFNNIICLCNDNSNNVKKDNISSNINEKNEEIIYHIDKLDINNNFENVNSIIKMEDLKRNNVKLIPINESFTHILTAYVKLIDNMKLIIYLPHWFIDYDLLKQVNTFVTGSGLIPYNINDIINNYSVYLDIMSPKEMKIIKYLKERKTSSSSEYL